MTTKHTPTPWQYIPDTCLDGGVRSKNGYICFMVNVTKFPNQEERYAKEIEERTANAQLIAQAPELLDFVKQQAEWLALVKSQIKGSEYVFIGFDHAIKVAETLIKNAEGN